jgi:hypothetical protein
MKRKTLLFTVGVLLSLVFLYECTGDSRKAHTGYSNLSSLIDSITVTPTKSGKYSLVSEFFEKLATLRQVEGTDSAYSTLFTFFSRLHPNIRITDSLPVLQMVEWIHNCFTMMDSGGIFFTNGVADTYAAWYLQRVEGIRPDLIVISLPFLVGSDYRRILLEDSRVRSSLNFSETDTLPVPTSTSETQDVLVEIITRQVSQPEHPPLYMAPACGIEGRFGGHIVYLGLVYAYQDSIQPQNQILDQLISKLTKSWQLRHGSQGFPADPRYAARVFVIQYLSLLLIIMPEFEKQERYQDMDTLFTCLEPVVGEDWRFPALRYKFCHQTEGECRGYLEKVKEYAAAHPDDPAVQRALEELEKK